MAPDAPARVRQQIKRLLEDRGRTQRALALALGHGDQWASNVLAGRQMLSLRDLDRIALFFGVPPGELVRLQDDSWELSPTEMRVVRGLRFLPPSVRDHYAILLDYTIGTTPDEIELLRRIRELDDESLRVVERWIDLKRFEQAPAPAAARRDVPLELDVPPDGRSRRTRAGSPKGKTRTG